MSEPSALPRLWWPPLLVFSLALVVYGLTAPRGLTWAHGSADGGDLVTAALVRGVPHPSGYPTWTLLAALFSQLPLGAPAWRAVLLSMVSGATAAALVSATVPRLTASAGIPAANRQTGPMRADREGPQDRIATAGSVVTAVPALVAGLTLAFAPLFWGQATVVEVYALHAACAAAALWALVRWQTGGHERWAAAAGLFLGLGLGNHLTTVWLLPAAAILLCTAGHRSRVRSSALLGSGLAAGLLVYFYLPVAAAGDPAVNWGDPRTLDRFWWLVSGQLYRGYVFAVAWADVPGRLAGWVGELARNFLPWGIALALLGLATLAERNRPLAGAFVCSLLLGLAWAVGYNTSDSLLTLLPGWVILALALGLGLARALDWLASQSPRVALAAALLSAVLAVMPLVLYWQEQDLRSDQTAEQFLRQVLAHVPPHAVIVSVGDRATFALWYGRYGLGLRPDVALISRDLWALSSYRATVASQHPDLTLAPKEDQAGPLPPADLSRLLGQAAAQRPLLVAQAGLAETLPSTPVILNYQAELALAGDGWVLWRLEP